MICTQIKHVMTLTTKSAFIKIILKVLLTAKCVRKCVFCVRKSNLCCFVWNHRREERETGLNVKGSQEDVVCVTSSSLSQWESSCGDSTSSRFQAVKGDRLPAMAVCHWAGLWALPGISQPGPGSLFSLACLLRALRENCCPLLACCWSDTWDRHMVRQRTAKGQAWPVLPGACASVQEQASQNWG